MGWDSWVGFFWADGFFFVRVRVRVCFRFDGGSFFCGMGDIPATFARASLVLLAHFSWTYTHLPPARRIRPSVSLQTLFPYTHPSYLTSATTGSVRFTSFPGRLKRSLAVQKRLIIFLAWSYKAVVERSNLSIYALPCLLCLSICPVGYTKCTALRFQTGAYGLVSDLSRLMGCFASYVCVYIGVEKGRMEVDMHVESSASRVHFDVSSLCEVECPCLLKARAHACRRRLDGS
ncbi:hypothetical protein EJ06DRAFT_346203 [Trichodelitschia bisporula]|uniref:Uncharacterized protein n=1 Tax=Trichodelitschia bisporula TaxID=703511 RepID=A0A6G1I2Q3_9PEZI|nr:hypothetical protein EJ06DRAFT_346203 [Trichodelitschia bisporula]